MQGEIQALLDAGYQPLALVPGEKYPIHKGWTSRTIEMEELKRYNLDRIGLRTGDNGLESIDVDAKNSENPEQMVKDFARKLKEAEITDDMVVIQRTASKGIHILYRTDDIKKNTKIALSTIGKALVETRGEGGCIVVYDNGILEEVDKLPILTKEQRDALWSIAASFDSRTSPSGSFKEYNKQNPCLDLLLKKGWKEVSRQGNSVKVLRDGNPTSTSSGTVFLDSNRAFIFSTSAGLPTEELLTPAAITCHFDFNGDWSKFSRSLTGSLNVQYTNSNTGSGLDIDYSTLKIKTFQEHCDSGASKGELRSVIGSLFTEKDIVMFFGPTNSGKSTASFQLADAIARGGDLWGLHNNLGAQKVLYFDFEQDDQQVAHKFKDMRTNENFLIVDRETLLSHGRTEWKKQKLSIMEGYIKASGAKMVFIDNITALNMDNTIEKDVGQLMEGLRDIRSNCDITMVVVGHTPKRPKDEPLELKDLAGSHLLSDIFLTLIAIGYCSGHSDRRYIKVLKSRLTKIEYNEDNVLVLELNDNKGFPSFDYVTQAREYELLKRRESERTDQIAEIKRLREQGLSIRAIEERLVIDGWEKPYKRQKISEILKDSDLSVRDERGGNDADRKDEYSKGFFDEDGEPEGAPF